MRTIIDVSVYLIVLTIMSFVSLEFILMNIQINKRQDAIDYMRDYVEIYGTSVGVDSEDEAYVLDSDVLDAIDGMAQENNFAVDVSYEESTDYYRYYRMTVSYPITAGLLGINITQNCVCLVRTRA